MSNSLMFQRFPTHNGFEDPQFSNFYGQTLPLLKRGIPVQTVHMENLAFPPTLKNIKVLVVSYSNMKPNKPDVHQYIADWVKKGGELIYCGRDDDPYQSVMEWWNIKGNKYKAPSQHLFKLLGIDPSSGREKFKVGKGTVHVIRQNPKEFVMENQNDDGYVKKVKQAYENDAKAGKLVFKNNFYLERGAYDIVSVLDENPDSKPVTIKGPVIDLFDPQLPVLDQKTVNPGEQAFLYDLSRVTNKKQPKVLASASRIYDGKVQGRSYTFTSKSPVNTLNSVRVLLPSEPGKVTVTDAGGKTVADVKTSWDKSSNTLYMGFDNSPEGIKVNVEW
jgi:hypothetical protein